MDRRCARIVLALATVAASCPSSDGGGASDVPAEAVQDLAADAAEDTAPPPVADLAPADARKEVGEKPLPPVVAGPPAHLFDCTHDPAKLPGHVSPVPLGCILDDACADVMVTSHRGAGGDFGTIAPQNTLAAIRAAIVMGVDAVELDVRDTKDGRFVLMHDGTVDKTTDGTGAVADMTLDEVRALHPKTDGLLSGGDFGCENVPTLEEAMDLAKDRVWIYLDTKTDKVPELVALIGS
ncbi:MAG: glycerophosphodiester phosphodiesterase family protein, partial [Deltaproteobacteria bacterium]|nr:glycerophosphodiester phosphodiesterase family protein [Deltaproteobacteria bacterium]